MFTAIEEVTALTNNDVIDDPIVAMVNRITPTAADVVDWHTTHRALRARWDSPMVNVLTWILGLEPFEADWPQNEDSDRDLADVENNVENGADSVFLVDLTMQLDEPEMVDL